MKEVIPYGQQDISEDDIEAIVDVLHSNYLTQGPVVPIFEEALTNYCHANYAVTVCNATSALHIACMALGVETGDIVWTTAITFVASANCAIYCGASVDFVDIDPDTYNMSIDSLKEKLAEAEQIDKLPSVLIPVHLCGQSCDMKAIYELSQQYKFKIIEDATHAIGGKYKSEPIGNCRYSDIVVFSFHPVKIITTGEGGAALTNNLELADNLRRFRSHGIVREGSKMHSRPSEEIWNYQQLEIGFNYRMTDFQAALGVSQMKRLDDFVKRRNKIAKLYDKELEHLPLITPWQHPDSSSSYHLYPIRLKLDEIIKTQRQVYNSLIAKKILVNLHYIPVYRQPFYEQMGFEAGYCPESEKYFTEAMSIPIYPTLTEAEQEKVIASISDEITL